MSEVRQTDYDPKDVIISFAGNQLTGFAEDSVVTIEAADDTYKEKIGADGFITRVRSRNQAATITLRLAHNSPSNDILNAKWQAGKLSKGMDVAPFGMTDLNNNTLVGAPFAWVKRMPTIERGADGGEYEWTLGTGYLEASLAGISPSILPGI